MLKEKYRFTYHKHTNCHVMSSHSSYIDQSILRCSEAEWKNAEWGMKGLFSTFYNHHFLHPHVML
jgi:hypothetical protein